MALDCGMRSSWISGSNTLGMSPAMDSTYPLAGRVSVPRQVVETVGCILEEVVKDDQREFFEILMSTFEKKERDTFYSVFLIVLGVLKGCEDASSDRCRHAREISKTVGSQRPKSLNEVAINPE